MTHMVFAATACVLAIAPLLAAQARQPDALQKRLDTLADRIARFEVVGFDVLYMPADVETRTRVTPEMLERQFHFRLTISDIRDWSDRAALMGALKSLSVSRLTDGKADLRWALIFSDLNSRRVEAIYFDGTGDKGFIGTDAVVFSGAFFRWLTERFLPLFR